MGELQTDGASQSQGGENLPLEDENLGAAAPRGDRFETLEARMDLLGQGLQQINQALANIGRPQMSQEQFEEEFDDDEPLNMRKVSKVVNQAINSAVAKSSDKAEREKWDTKARSEFPISDPKFEAEFNRQWASFRDAGGNMNHPRAVYKVCQDVARVLGSSKPAPRREQSGEHISGEAPTSGANQASQRRASSSKISDDDPRVTFFKLRNSDPKKIQKFKEGLEAKDREAVERQRRRTGA